MSTKGFDSHGGSVPKEISVSKATRDPRAIDRERSVRQEVAEAICKICGQWESDPTPREINSGMCVEFAETVADTFGPSLLGASIAGCEVGGEEPMGPWGGHVWLYLEETGTHHDVEAPLGVWDWKAFRFTSGRGCGSCSSS